ncbi:MAG: hypothetical protein ACE5E1_06560 [Phycisphaerae bacterium]
MTTKDGLKLGLAVALLGAAAALYFVYNTGDEGIPDTDEMRTAWYCSACGKGFELTGPEMVTAVGTRFQEGSDEEAEAAGGAAPRGHGSRAMVKVARCKDCGQMTGQAAHKCPDCGGIFPALNEDGEPNICPKCTWDPTTGRKSESP